MAQQNQNQKQTGGQRDASQTDVNSRNEKDFSSSNSKGTQKPTDRSEDSKQWSQTGSRDQGSGLNQQGQQDSTTRQAPTSTRK